MGIFGTLGIGVSGLRAAEAQINATGHNISNVDNDHYTRQRVVQSAVEPFHDIPGDVGNGTQVSHIMRIHDEFAFARLRNSENALAYTGYKKGILQEIAQNFPDLQDVGILKDLQNYFAAWNDFASHSSDGAQKINLIQYAKNLVANMQNTSDKLHKIKKIVNNQIKIAVEEFNRVAKEIANLNGQIQRVEIIDGNHANDLRDKRDQLEKTLANLANIAVFKGSLKSDTSIDRNLTDMGRDYNLNLGGYTIVDGTNFHPLSVESSDVTEDFYSVYYERQDGKIVDIMPSITGGKIGAQLDLRGRYLDTRTQKSEDGIIQKYINDLDTLAKTMIMHTNNIYAKSAQDSVSSKELSFLKKESTVTNFSEDINQGSFDVIVYNKQGKEIARKTIHINSGTTMDDPRRGNSIVKDFNSNTDDNNDNNSNNDVDDYFTAAYKYRNDINSGIFTISPKFPKGEYSIAFEDRGTNFSGIFGLNEFFEGNNARNMKVSSKFNDDPSVLKGYKAPIVGNNEVANEMVQLQYKKLDFKYLNQTDKSETIEGFYRYLTATIASQTETNNHAHDTSLALNKSILAEYESISGVNINEELTNLMRFQASYGASAKVITTVDKMLDTLLSIKQ